MLFGCIVCFVCALYVLSQYLQEFILSRSFHHLSDFSYDEDGINRTNLDGPFLVDTPYCKIPNLDPLDISVRHWVRQPMRVACPRDLSLTYVFGGKLFVNWTAVNISYSNEGKMVAYCRYQSIRHPENGKHNDYSYSVESDKFREWVNVSEEFIRTQCYNASNNVIYTNFHYVINHLYSKTDVEVPPERRTPNVLLVGVDSVSRMNYIRYMKKTRQVMLKLGALEFVGYNKVADNTFVNLVPLLAGKFAEELPWNEKIRHQTFDPFRFLWNDYRDRGFTTLFVEDSPLTAMFDNAKAGFRKKPTDFYNRAMAVAMEETNEIWFENHFCVLDRLETDILLDYVYSLIRMMSKHPYFALVYLSRMTHDYIEDAGTIDDSIYRFFDDLRASRLLENTVVVLFSDHGMRFGEIRNTYIGKLEERLPLLNIVIPTRFAKGRMKELHNLMTNANRLTTPFDIYEFLKHLLYFDDYKPSSTYGVSLMNTIPLNRTCPSAMISSHWCTCTEMIIVQNNSSIVNMISNLFVRIINAKFINISDQCATLNLDNIESSYLIKPLDSLLKFESSENEVLNQKIRYGDPVNPVVDYQVTIRTRPGGGVFEGTFRHNEEYMALDLVSDISRLNRYRDGSYCIQNSELKKYCYCANN